MDIGEFLRGERYAREMTQVSLASRTGVGQSRISEFEHGIRSPTWATVERLLEGMGRRPLLDTRPLDEAPVTPLEELRQDPDVAPSLKGAR